MAVSLTGMTLHTNNDAETWTGTDGADTYFNSVQGTNSESWQLSKNTTETATLTKSAALNASRGVVNIWLASSISTIYTNIVMRLQSSASNFKQFGIATDLARNVSGDFKAFAFDYVNKGALTGTFVPTSLTVLEVDITTANTNFRAIPNNWIDAIYFGAGHTIAGTTVGNKLFTEAAAVDQLIANQYGVLNNFNSIIYSQADITLTGTALVSTGETLVFIDTANGYDRYNFNGTGTATFTNTNITSAGAIDFDLDMSSMTAFSMIGGSIVQCNQLTLASGQTLDGVVLTDVALSSISNNPIGCTWNASGQITISGSGVITNCTVKNNTVTTNTAAVVVASLSDLVTSEITTVGTGHAVELTSIGAGSMTWDTVTSGYNAGATGSPITPTSTGNESLFVNVASGTLTINVDGGTVPSIRSAGATINVVAGLATLTLKGLVTGSDIIINTSGTNTPLVDIDQNVGSSYGYSYTYVPGTLVDIKIMLAGYLPYQVYDLQLTNSTVAELPVAQQVDRTYI